MVVIMLLSGRVAVAMIILSRAEFDLWRRLIVAGSTLIGRLGLRLGAASQGEGCHRSKEDVAKWFSHK